MNLRTNVRRQKGVKQGASIKSDLWKRIGFIPSWKSVRQRHKDDYEARAKLPDGAGTGRSNGSNKCLRAKMGY